MPRIVPVVSIETVVDEVQATVPARRALVRHGELDLVGRGLGGGLGAAARLPRIGEIRALVDVEIKVDGIKRDDVRQHGLVAR